MFPSNLKFYLHLEHFISNLDLKFDMAAQPFLLGGQSSSQILHNVEQDA